jgi:hypothetical protein
MIGRISCSSFGDAIKKIQATQCEYDLYGDWNLEAVKRFLSEKMNNNDLSFGGYVKIEQKRYGVENEMYLHKVIGASESNAWVDVPVQTPAKEILHNKLEPVVSCICCGVCETEVLRYRIKDVKKVK